MDMKERYLKNPHITLDDRRKAQLEITDEDVESNEVAIELPNIGVPTNKEVIMRKKKQNDPDSNTVSWD